LLGRKDIKTALRYTRSDDEDRRAAMEALEKSQSQHNRRTGDKRKDNQQLAPVRAPAPKAARPIEEPLSAGMKAMRASVARLKHPRFDAGIGTSGGRIGPKPVGYPQGISRTSFQFVRAQR
jgi:hypothetical protein